MMISNKNLLLLGIFMVTRRPILIIISNKNLICFTKLFNFMFLFLANNNIILSIKNLTFVIYYRMSLNLVPVKAEKVYDPRINLNSHRDYVVLKGGRINQFQTCQATGSPFTSGSSISITCNPPSRANAVCRKVLQNYVVQFTITGTNTSGGPLLNSGYYGPRSFPLERALSTPQMQIE